MDCSNLIVWNFVSNQEVEIRWPLPEMCRSQVLDLVAHDTEAGAFKRSVLLSASIKSSCSQFSIFL